MMMNFPKEGFENVVHKGLKSSWDIGKAKWHDKVLKMAIVCFEDCFMFFTGSNSHLMVSRLEIKLGKIVAPPNSSIRSSIRGIGK